jgi:hypothetical protein
MMISYVGRLSPNSKQRERDLLVMQKLLGGHMRVGEVNLLLWYVPFFKRKTQRRERLMIAIGLRT